MFKNGEKMITFYKEKIPNFNMMLDKQILSTGLLVITNLACQIIKISAQHTLLANLPLRLFCAYHAGMEKKYHRFIFIFLPLVMLCQPYGILFLITMDVAFTIFDTSLLKIKNNKSFIKKTDLNLLDPTIRENAMKILNLNEQEVSDINIITDHYNKAKTALETRLPKFSSPLAQSVRMLLDNVKQAYTTLTGKTAL